MSSIKTLTTAYGNTAGALGMFKTFITRVPPLRHATTPVDKFVVLCKPNFNMIGAPLKALL